MHLEQHAKSKTYGELSKIETQYPQKISSVTIRYQSEPDYVVEYKKLTFVVPNVSLLALQANILFGPCRAFGQDKHGIL